MATVLNLKHSNYNVAINHFFISMDLYNLLRNS